MMTKKNLYKLLVLGGLVLVLVIYLVMKSWTANVSQPGNQQPAPTGTSTPETASAATSSTTTGPTTIKKPSVQTGQTASDAYLSALNVYQKSGYYMQFFPCQASPGSLILKQGSKVMLDNRDVKAHVIGIRSVRYNIGSYNFAIATLNSLGTNYVTCDGGGSAQITVVP